MKISIYAVPGVQKVTTEEQIFRQVCDAYGYSTKEVRNNPKSRKRDFVEIRQLSMFIIRRELQLSYNKIGDFLNKDHATVLFGIRNVKNLLETDKQFQRKTSKIPML